MSAPAVEVVDDWRGMAVKLGLGTPLRRATLALGVTGGVLYLAKWPKGAFREDGSVKGHAALTPELDGTGISDNFLFVPVAVAAGVFLFT